MQSTSALEDAFYTELYAIANTTTFSSNCSQCIAGAEVLHFAALTLPVDNFVNILIRMSVERVRVGSDQANLRQM